jgi:AbrB family looped-hinge helix DNA binding protein
VNVATVTSKGQVTLPVSIRKRLGIREGSRIVFLEDEEGVRVLTEEALHRMFAVFDRVRKQTGLTRKQLRARVKEARHRLWKEHYAGRR